LVHVLRRKTKGSHGESREKTKGKAEGKTEGRQSEDAFARFFPISLPSFFPHSSLFLPFERLKAAFIDLQAEISDNTDLRQPGARNHVGKEKGMEGHA
jgi:hypothetical protein